MENSLVNFGQKVRAIRKELKLSQEDLGAMINRDARSVVAIESGQRNFTMRTLKAICDALKVSSSELLDF